MRITKTTVLMTVLIIIAAVTFWGLDRLTRVALSPQVQRDEPLVIYLGQTAFYLSNGFKTEAGRLQMICDGSAELTTVVEVPYHNGGSALYEQLRQLVPEGGRHFLMKDLSGNFERPAHLVFTDPGPTDALASVIMDFGSGSIRLSRPVKYDSGAGAYDSKVFEDDARRFSQNYVWGHAGYNPQDLHSLQGRVRPRQGCRDYQANIRFVSDFHSAKLVMVNDRNKDLNAVAAENGLELALEGNLTDSPGRFSELAKLKQGIWNRKVQGGPRLVAGQPGLEWVVLRHDLGTGRKYFVALWRPDPNQSPAIPALLMTAGQDEAAKALYYWNQLLNKSSMLGDPAEI